MSEIILLDALPGGATDDLVLSYDDRLVRRKRLITAAGRDILVDFPAVVDLSAHVGMRMPDGTVIALHAASEDVMVVRGDLPRLAWHVGNRHTPCAFQGDALILRADPVLRDMLLGLGAVVTDARAPFRPEGGAYGHGRTMGHDHSHD
ncbi:urease accessory protein UreE [Jannaschia sp. LMIT008]|uniref:urease accessory protein UreE n=1 Tax=Jannaschia maritima TaxID=3032585 RepID=UPI0028122F3C|nr:urease accessory protein UreE [Jannaschia sp. LMIT008]